MLDPAAPTERADIAALLPIETHDVGGPVQTVDARRLHGVLGAGKDFSNWIKGRIAAYAFVEGFDYMAEVSARSGEKGGRPSREYHLTIDMAKEIAMVDRSETGQQVRRYFIECERRARGLTGESPALALLRRTDGIARQLSHKFVGLERSVELILARLDGAAPDPSVRATVEFKPALEVCGGAPPKKRRGLVRRVSGRLLRYSIQHGHPLREEPYTGRRLYHVDAITGWLDSEGRGVLATHIAAVAGQTVLPFTPKGR